MIALLAAAFICHVGPIHDGDTIRCQEGQRVRLWGVNAAELNDPGGQDARRALTRMISGKVLVCQKRGKSYDRVVALCRLNGHDIAAEMVREGFAVDWPRYSHGFYRRGVW